MSELFEQEKPKRPEYCPKCYSANIQRLVSGKDGVIVSVTYHCMDCGKEVK